MDKSQLAGKIDTSWHHSWHWDCDKYGYLTEQGYRDALVSCQREIGYSLDRLAGLREAEAFLKDRVTI